MKEKSNKRFINNPWTINIGSGLFILVATLLTDATKSKPIFTTINQIFNFVIGIIKTILFFKIAVIWIITAIILLFIILFIIKKDATDVTLPEFTKYKSEVFKKWRWSWEWKYNERKQEWYIAYLTPHCPNCDTPLMDNSSSYYERGMDCPRCSYKSLSINYEDSESTKVLITDNANKRFK